MQCYAAPRDYTLLEEQGDGDFVLIVLTGKVGLVKVVLRHSVKQIAEVGAGASLVELLLIDGRKRFAICITMALIDFAILTRHSLNELLIHYLRLASKLLLVMMQVMKVRMRKTSDRFLPIVYSAIP